MSENENNEITMKLTEAEYFSEAFEIEILGSGTVKQKTFIIYCK